jgi:hypothetical protein
MMKFLTTAGFLVLLGGAAALGYRLAANRIATDIYRDRLRVLSSEYEGLRTQYNEAVRRTAVTELFIEDGKLFVSIPMPDGHRQTIETPFDPAQEIYCGYVNIDGRLWIRQMYDRRTAPQQGLKLDTRLEFIDWDAPGVKDGHAVYRPLSGAKRWMVTVTGDGAMALVPVEGEAPLPLTYAPQVRDYEQIEKQIGSEISEIGPGDVWRKLVGGDE